MFSAMVRQVSIDLSVPLKRDGSYISVTHNGLSKIIDAVVYHFYQLNNPWLQDSELTIVVLSLGKVVEGLCACNDIFEMPELISNPSLRLSAQPK